MLRGKVQIPAGANEFYLDVLKALLKRQIDTRSNFSRVLIHLALIVVFVSTAASQLATHTSHMPVNSITTVINNAQFGSGGLSSIVADNDVWSWLIQGMLPSLWGYDWMPTADTSVQPRPGVQPQDDEQIFWDNSQNIYNISNKENWFVRKYNLVVGGILLRQSRGRSSHCRPVGFAGPGFREYCFGETVSKTTVDSYFGRGAASEAARMKFNNDTGTLSNAPAFAQLSLDHFAGNTNRSDSAAMAAVVQRIQQRLTRPFTGEAPRATADAAGAAGVASVSSLAAGLFATSQSSLSVHPGESVALLHIEESLASSLAYMAFLRRHMWLDRQTRELQLWIPLYNKIHETFVTPVVTFRFDTGGFIQASVRVHVVRLETYQSTQAQLRLVVELALLLWAASVFVLRTRAMLAPNCCARSRVSALHRHSHRHGGHGHNGSSSSSHTQRLSRYQGPSSGSRNGNSSGSGGGGSASSKATGKRGAVPKASPWRRFVASSAVTSLRRHAHNLRAGLSSADAVLELTVSVLVLVMAGQWLLLCVQWRVDHFFARIGVDLDTAQGSAELARTIDLIASYSSKFTTYRMLSGVTSILLFARMFILMDFHPKFGLLNKMLKSSMSDLFYFTAMFLVAFLAFVTTSHFVFGVRMPSYSTFPLAFNTNFLILLGTFNQQAMLADHPLLAVLFFYLYTISLVWVLINVFIGIVSNGYAVAKDASLQAEAAAARSGVPALNLQTKLLRVPLHTVLAKVMAEVNGGAYHCREVNGRRVVDAFNLNCWVDEVLPTVVQLDAFMSSKLLTLCLVPPEDLEEAPLAPTPAAASMAKEEAAMSAPFAGSPTSPGSGYRGRSSRGVVEAPAAFFGGIYSGALGSGGGSPPPGMTAQQQQAMLSTVISATLQQVLGQQQLQQEQQQQLVATATSAISAAVTGLAVAGVLHPSTLLLCAQSIGNAQEQSTDSAAGGLSTTADGTSAENGNRRPTAATTAAAGGKAPPPAATAAATPGAGRVPVLTRQQSNVRRGRGPALPFSPSARAAAAEAAATAAAPHHQRRSRRSKLATVPPSS